MNSIEFSLISARVASVERSLNAKISSAPFPIGLKSLKNFEASQLLAFSNPKLSY